MAIPDAIWAHVRAAYEANEISIAAICAKFELTSATLYRRRIKEGWPLRGTQPAAFAAIGSRSGPNVAPAILLDNSPAAIPTPKWPATNARAARAALILRLYNAIDLKLTQMEHLMTNPDPAAPTTTSADHERETRALTGLIRNFEHVTELNADLTRPAGRHAAKSTRAAPEAATSPADAASGAPALTSAPVLPAPPANAEFLRRDIAERLGRILAHGNPPGDAG